MIRVGPGFRWWSTAIIVAIAGLAVHADAGAAGSGGVESRIQVSPVLVALEISASTAAAGERIQVRVTVTNVGPRSLRGIALEVRADPDGLRLSRSAAEIANLRPGSTASAQWTVCARSPGAYVMVAVATVDGASIESGARVLTVIPGVARACL